MSETNEQQQDKEAAIDAAIRDAKAKAGADDVMVVETDVQGAEVAAFRVPTPAEWKKYRTDRDSGDRNVAYGAGRDLVMVCCIFPASESFAARLQAHPGLVETYQGELIAHAGANRAKKVRKL